VLLATTWRLRSTNGFKSFSFAGPPRSVKLTLGSPQEITYLDSGLMMTLHFGRDADRFMRSAMGRKSRGKRRTPVS
jgi:hypothetical protein